MCLLRGIDLRKEERRLPVVPVLDRSKSAMALMKIEDCVRGGESSRRFGVAREIPSERERNDCDG